VNEEKLELTPPEKFVLDRAADLATPRRRVRIVVVSALLLVAALIVLSPMVGSWQLLLFFAVAYVLVTAWERIVYARMLLVYKGLIRKLAHRIDEMETGSAAGPDVS
jgi:hypothetical protein